MPVTTVVFDAYGTLFDVSAAARALAATPEGAHLAGTWPQVAAVWRQKQLQYTWLRAAYGTHADFWTVTREGLDFAAEAVGGVTEADKAALLDLYWRLECYPEVPEMLGTLKARGLTTAILSNGSPDMLAGAIESAGVGDRLDAALSCQSVGVFKPDPRVYELVGRAFGCATREVLFVSSNGWDAAAATGFGFRTVWVNRAGEPMDRLPWTPEETMADLTAIPALAERL